MRSATLILPAGAGGTPKKRWAIVVSLWQESARKNLRFVFGGPRENPARNLRVALKLRGSAFALRDREDG